MKNCILSHLPGEYPWADELLCFDSIPSTNDFLKKLAREGAPHGTVIIADHQTTGRLQMLLFQQGAEEPDIRLAESKSRGKVNTVKHIVQTSIL